MKKNVIWAIFDDTRIEIGISERGEHPEDADILFDVDAIPGNGILDSILLATSRAISGWRGIGVPAYPPDNAGDAFF